MPPLDIAPARGKLGVVIFAYEWGIVQVGRPGKLAELQARPSAAPLIRKRMHGGNQREHGAQPHASSP